MSEQTADKASERIIYQRQNNQPGNKNFIIILIIIALIAGGFFVYKNFFKPQNGGTMWGGHGAAPVGIAEVIEREVQQWQNFSGRLVAVDKAEIRPQISGIIESIHFNEGEMVEKGQLLFTIDQRPYQAALLAANAQLTLADAEWDRAQELLRDKVITQSEFDRRRNAVEVARADFTKAKLDYNYTMIKAPVSGRVSRAEITAGNLVNAGANAPILTTVVSNNQIYADFAIDEYMAMKYLQQVGGDMEKLKNIPVKLILSGDNSNIYEGHVQSFDNQLDPGTGTLRVRAIFDNKDGKLIPGLFAGIQLGSAGTSKEILITDRAIGTDQNKKFVLVVDKDNKVEYREIKLGGSAENLRIVREGLKPGERIIINGLQRAQPGMPVAPETVSMEARESPAQSTNPQSAGNNSSDSSQEAP